MQLATIFTMPDFFIHWILIHGIYYSHKGLNDKIIPPIKTFEKKIYMFLRLNQLLNSDTKQIPFHFVHTVHKYVLQVLITYF